MAQDASVNSGARPRADTAPDRVARTQIKYHRWANHGCLTGIIVVESPLR